MTSTPRILILGAGFGGLELASLLSERFGERIDVTLIDKAEGFVFGFAKLDVMFGYKTAEGVRLPYRDVAKPGVRMLRETVIAIDPAAKRVTTDAGTHEADVLVIALGADYDVSKTPGVVLGQNEFYSVEGAAHLREVLPSFREGDAVVGVCGAPYKCPPAPSECALMLHDYLSRRGVRDRCTITLVNPLPSPVPPSPETSKALIEAFMERGIVYFPGHRPVSVDRARKIVTLDDGRDLPCDLFLGIPKNTAPAVVVATGLTQDGFVMVDHHTLETKVENVYAIGDVANNGAPKAGVFAEACAKTVGANLIAKLEGREPTAKYPGAGSCYIEFGADRVARVDVDFFSGPKPTGTFHAPSEALRADKREFGRSRRLRWFGLPK
ncbi:MAG TPA: FAD-dependent oxidoreductase [Candidatus Polarisedimenticolaceae bacterium]|nr:FAD-dependent oxidoreductase [Candidatus Polarisedimenticolaceae bacterium]